MAPYIGTGTARVDGVAKVTGAAKYAAEFNAPGLLHGSIVTSTIAKGRITRIETNAAKRVKGVIDVLTHANRPQMADNDKAYKDDVAPLGSPFRPLYDDKIKFNGQPIALVCRRNVGVARFAASLVGVSTRRRRTPPTYGGAMRRSPSNLRTNAFEAMLTPPKPRGAPSRRSRRCAGAPRGRILHADRASQPDGALAIDGNL